MKVIKDYSSPNFSTEVISVDFVVLHYTACDIKRTLEIFLNPLTQVTSHFILDTNGDCYDLGDFLSPKSSILKGAHAGKSHVEIDGAKYEALNQNSIGIEIVNLNGNVLPYTEAQYLALSQLLQQLQRRFPSLQSASRIIGHEHIAHWRGKADPGRMFDWNRVLNSVGLKKQLIHDFFACDDSDLEFVNEKIKQHKGLDLQAQFWSDLSSQLEKRIAARASGK